LFNSFLKPGIYAIINKVTKKRYIGETLNLAGRLSTHFKLLRDNRHHCPALQKDFNRLGQKKFDFVVLKRRAIFKNSTTRRKIQNLYIQQNIGNCYNKSGYSPVKKNVKKENVLAQRNRSISVIINDVLYTSVSDAARHMKMHTSTILQYLHSKDYPNWKYVEPFKHFTNNTSKAVVGPNNTYYASMRAAGIEYGVSAYVIRNYCRNRNEGWAFYNDLTADEKKNISNLNDVLKSFDMYTGARRVKVGTEVYSSISEAARAYGITHCAVPKRIHSSTFPEWQWADS